jgi:hypothetical protein
VLYARAPNTFQARYLHLRSPLANLGEAAASASSVSLPSLRATSPGGASQHSVEVLSGSETGSVRSASGSTRRGSRLRGAAPPSSFSMARLGSRGAGSSSRSSASSAAGSGDESDSTAGGHSVRRKRSALTPASAALAAGRSISRPQSRDSVASSARSSFSTPRGAIDSDLESLGGDSIVSHASTLRAPLPLGEISPEFFEATLEYLYTAEESMVDAFEFLYEDRVALAGQPEERLEKLRQDFVFMWRSRLYADVRIVLDGAALGEEPMRPRTIPDNASVLSMAVTMTDGGHGDEEAQGEDGAAAVFSSHRMVLASRSPYFAAQLLGPYADSDTDEIRLPSPPFTPASLHFTLGFIYTGTLFFSNRTFDLATAFQLWRAGAYLQIDTLQALVSSLIAADFCHGFACSPPCKTCVKRVPRTLAFASAPDVGDAHLRDCARHAVSGRHFGVYWARDVGSLDYAARGALVADVCARIDAQPAQCINVLGQLSAVGSRIDRERSSAWVDALRWMCESVEAHIRGVLEPHFATIVAGTEWLELLDGVGFAHDVLEKVLALLVDSLNERRAALTYQTLVGQVLLRDEGPPPEGLPRRLVEEARDATLRYLRKRWVNVRALSGFNALEKWALKELSHELDVPAADLLLPEVEPLPEALRTRTGLKPVMPKRKVDDEDNVGPINLRAAVVNRAAARAAVTHGFRSGTQATYSPPQPSVSVMSRSRGAPVVRTPSSSTTSSVSTRESTTSGVSRSRETSASSQPTATAPTPAMRTTSRTASSAAPSAAKMSADARVRRIASSSGASDSRAASTGARTPTASLRSVRSNLAPVARTPPASPAPKQDESVRTPTAARTLGSKSAVPASGTLRATPSNSSMRSTAANVTPRASASASAGRALRPQTSQTSLSNAKRHTFLKATPRPGGAPATATTRSRLDSTASTASLPRRADSGASSASTGSVRRLSSAKAALRKAPPSPLPGAKGLPARQVEATEARTPLAPIPAPASGPMDVDVGPLASGTSLAHGIACIVSPQSSGALVASRARFRALVKYIGPLGGEEGAWVGVEVELPLPAGLEALSARLHDGSLRGQRYFELGTPAETSDEPAAPMPEREARRRRIAQMIGPREEALPSAKRRKDAAGQGVEPEAPTRGLFLRPQDVLWVLT